MTREEAAALLERWADKGLVPSDDEARAAFVVAIAALRSPGATELHIVFDGPPGPESGRFVECETADGRGVRAGEWRKVGDYWHLVIPRPPGAAEMREALIEVAARARMNFITTDEAWADRHQPCSMTKIVTPIVDDWLTRHALPAPEVPEAVRAWVASYDDEATAGAHHLAVDDALREFYRKGYGI